MSYLSIEFMLAFVAFFPVYWALRRWPRAQNVLLLIASYGFYSLLDIRFAGILLAYTLILHVISWRISASKYSRGWLRFGVVFALSNLAVFKYFDFFRESIQTVLRGLGIDAVLPGVELLLPVGISFYTFQSITYLVSVYRWEIKRAPLLEFSLFLSFFPTLLAGPICRAKDMLAQLCAGEKRQVLYPQLAMVLLILALLKKLWLASWLAANWVDPVFVQPGEMNPLEILSSIYAYTLQIYLDFSGYTDLVTALALLLGLRIPKNFDAPYLANNLRDFWRRWHMSLSSWIRDYIYIPLGGSRDGFSRTQLNLMAAMLLSGLWHGASGKYLVWGALHGAGVVALNIGDRWLGHKDGLTRYSPWLSRVLTFHYVALAWVFFRAQSLSDGWELICSLFTQSIYTAMTLPALPFLVGITAWFVALPWLSRLPEKATCLLQRTPWWLQPVPLILLALLIVGFSPSGIPGFIYYQF